MHILLIHLNFASPDQPGGTRHYELAKYCVGQGHRVSVVASNLDYKTGKRVVNRRGLIEEQNLDGIRVLRAYTYPALHRSFLWRFFSFLSFTITAVVAALRVGPVDIVMGTSPQILQAVSASWVATVRRRPFLLEIRDLWPEFGVALGVLKNPVLIGLARRLEGFLYSNATHLLVNSPAYREYLMSKGVPEVKISFIANGVDPAMFDPQSKGEHLRQEWGLDGRFVVTYAGALGLANDIPTILRAAERLRGETDIHFLLVGDGKDRAKLEGMMRQFQLSNVTFTGAQRKADMKEVLAASDACIATLQNTPMLRTTYPNKVFDYMAAGRPTILAIDGVIREVIDRAEGGIFVPPGNDEALAAAVQSLSRDRHQAEAMGKAARTYVVEHFNRHQQAMQFVELLERVVARRT